MDRALPKLDPKFGPGTRVREANVLTLQVAGTLSVQTKLVPRYALIGRTGHRKTRSQACPETRRAGTALGVKHYGAQRYRAQYG